MSASALLVLPPATHFGDKDHFHSLAVTDREPSDADAAEWRYQHQNQAYYPALLDIVLDYAEHDTSSLLVARSLNRAFRHRVDSLLARHVAFTSRPNSNPNPKSHCSAEPADKDAEAATEAGWRASLSHRSGLQLPFRADHTRVQQLLTKTRVIDLHGHPSWPVSSKLSQLVPQVATVRLKHYHTGISLQPCPVVSQTLVVFAHLPLCTHATPSATATATSAPSRVGLVPHGVERVVLVLSVSRTRPRVSDSHALALRLLPATVGHVVVALKPVERAEYPLSHARHELRDVLGQAVCENLGVAFVVVGMEEMGAGLRLGWVEDSVCALTCAEYRALVGEEQYELQTTE
ncbi:uncharacterized protein EHS24_002518 [Apiotrichum porosum]|uniref:Uncharacterized protein n=1 Tax=Apiotrichum porosum TaxID=105984 RepID=A0A427XH25_9TREE|nr:uncharacterized protein EHS24_002518 [Apiotrichum porosum]RSH78063.1 hypothetical protein EHS24_002518 [Apiotrichum porosum]